VLVKLNGTALSYVPVELRTAELCAEAVKRDGGAIEYVSAELRTEEMYLEAFWQAKLPLASVPVAFRTQAMCLEAVRRDSRAIEAVPVRMRTAEVYLEVVKYLFEKEIEIVPLGMRTEVRQALASLLVVPGPREQGLRD